MNSRIEAQFRATSGPLQGFGKTPQEALSALMEGLCGDAPAPIVVSPYNKGDAFFSGAKQARLQELKDRGDTLTAEERAELESLVADAFDATIERRSGRPPGNISRQALSPDQASRCSVLNSIRA